MIAESEATVLIVEDDPEEAALQRRWLERAGYRVAWAATAEEALRSIAEGEVGLIVMDYRLASPDTGLDLYEQMKTAGHQCPVIMVTGYGDAAVVVRALRAGIRDFVPKSLQYLDYLPGAVRRVLREASLEQQLAEHAALLDRATDAILVKDPKGYIRFWNQGAERVYGWPASEALGRNVAELLFPAADPEPLAAHRQVMEKGEWSGELRQRTRDKRDILVESHQTLMRDEAGRPRSILVINSDITEKRKLEAQHLRAQRLESLGALAGGIAHDLNNVLTPILTGAELLKLPAPPERQQAVLETICTNAERGAALVQQILSFARGAPGQRLPLQLQPILKGTYKLLEHSLPKSIELAFSVPTDLWWITGDATQISQVLMNLCVNARDAMPNGGRLNIGAENVIVNETLVQAHPRAKPGSYVLLQVSDTGTGIPRELLDKIFDPFFTTKEPGRGTGLGLATAQAIVSGYGGFFHVDSEPGRGSCFSVYLPARPSVEIERAAPPVPESPHGHGELVLVVDDERGIREMARTILEAHGYRVITANDMEAAVGVYRDRQEEIALVLLDLTMPVLDGAKAIRALRQLDPKVRIVATSGLATAGGTESAAFLQKPYTAQKLLQTVQDALRAK